jgi:hypothetical protein
MTAPSDFFDPRASEPFTEVVENANAGAAALKSPSADGRRGCDKAALHKIAACFVSEERGHRQDERRLIGVGRSAR